MLNLRNVLELINNESNNRVFAEQETVRQGHRQTVLRVGFQLGNELDPEGHAKKLNQWERSLAFISKNLANQLMDQVWNRFAIIHIGWGHYSIEQFAAVIDQQTQFEAKEPARRGNSPYGQPNKDFVRGNTLVQADIQGGWSTKEMPVQLPRQVDLK